MQHSWLRSFHFTASLGRISLAAHRLNVSNSSISTQIKQLEDYFGLLLFRRAERRLKLTPAGDKLLLETEKYFRLESSIRALLESEGTNNGQSLRIGSEYPSTTALAIQRAVPKPDRDRINLYGGSRETLLSWFENGEIDIVLCHSAKKDKTTLQGLKLPISNDRVEFLCGRGYLAAHGLTTDLPDIRSLIASHTWILPRRGYAARSQFDHLCAHLASEPQSVIETASYAGVSEALRANLGIGLLVRHQNRLGFFGAGAEGLASLEPANTSEGKELLLLERHLFCQDAVKQRRVAKLLIDHCTGENHMPD